MERNIPQIWYQTVTIVRVPIKKFENNFSIGISLFLNFSLKSHFMKIVKIIVDLFDCKFHDEKL